MRVAPKADNCRNYTQCDSLLLSDTCGAHTLFPEIQVANPSKVVEHEATTSKTSEQQLFYCNQSEAYLPRESRGSDCERLCPVKS